MLRWLARRFVGHVQAELVMRDATGKLVPTERAQAILDGLAPAFIGAAIKDIKVAKPGLSLPAGIDLSNLSSALPAILPMLPKRYQGWAALLAPLLGNLGGSGGGQKGSPPSGGSSW